jgi:hypothetical protein
MPALLFLPEKGKCAVYPPTRNRREWEKKDGITR